MARNICHLVAPRIVKNKIAEGDEYLHLGNIRAGAKPWNTSFGAFLEREWRVLNSLKHPHWTGRGKTANPQSHPLRVSSLSSSQQRGESLRIYMFASCLLCIAHKKTTNKEERLRCNERLSRD